MTGTNDVWTTLDIGAARALELAHQALLAGGLPVGSVLTDATAIVAEGRNHAYDAPTGADPLEFTPLAHAEMNALARLDTDRDVADLTIWSTQQPCSMCQAAIDFIGIPSLRVIARDPSDPDRPAADAVEDEWVVLATAMFLVGPIRRRGPEHPTVVANTPIEPESVRLALAAASGTHPLSDGRPLRTAIELLWADLTTAADHRRSRRAH